MKLKRGREMDRVGERHAAVVARALEAAEIAAQETQAPELALGRRIAQPQAGRIIEEDMSDLEDAACFRRHLGQHLRFTAGDRQRLLDQHVLAGFEAAPGEIEVARRGCRDHHAFDLGQEGERIAARTLGGEAGLGECFEARGIGVGAIERHRQGPQDAQMIGAPAAEPDKKYAGHEC